MVEGEKSLCSAFQRNRHVQQVDRALPLASCVLLAQLVRSTKDAYPICDSVDQNSVAQVLINLPEGKLAFGGAHVAKRDGVAQGVPHLYPVQRRERERSSRSRKK